MRVWRRTAVICLAALALLALGAYTARRAIVTQIAEVLLSRQGHPEAVLEVVEVTPWRIRLAKIAVPGLQAEAATLHYDPLALLAGKISRVEIDGARIELDLTRPGDAGRIEIPKLPPIRLTAGELYAVLPAGRIGLDVTAALETAPDGQLQGEASFEGGSKLGRLSGRLRLESGGGLSLELAAGLGPESPLWAELGLPAPAAGVLQGEVRLTATSLALDRLPETPIAWLHLAADRGLAGDLRLQLAGLRWPALEQPVSLQAPLSFRSEAKALEIALPSEIDLTGLPALDDVLAGDRATAADLLRLLEGTTKLTFGKDAEAPPVLRLSLGETDGGALSFAGGIGIEAAGRQRLAVSGSARVDLDPALVPVSFRVEALQAALQDLTVNGHSVETAGFTGSLQGDARSLKAQGALRAALRDLEIDAFRFGKARFEGPVAVDAGPEGATAELNGAATLSWEAARSSLGFALPEAHRLRLAALRARRHGGELSYEAEVDPGEVTLRIEDPDKPLDLRAVFQPLRIAGRWSEAQGLDLRARIPLRRLAVPQLKLEARDILATETLRPADGVAHVTLTVAELRQTGAEPAFTPFRLQGRLDHADGPLTFTAAGRTAAGVRLFELEGRHDIEEGNGSAEVFLAEDLFGPGPRHLPELAPVAPDLTVTGGRVTGNAEIAWRGGDLRGSGRLSLNEVGLKGPALTLEGLTGELAFAELFPPRSTPGQRLTARRLDLGETLRDLSARFAISAQGPEQTLVIDIERAEAQSIFGPLSMTEGRAEPQSGRYRLPLQFADLDLGKLSETAAIEGLAGEGHLSGLIPLEISDSRLRLTGAGLSNRGAGILRFRSEAALRALAAGGEPVELMLKALEDFRYEELKLSADTSDGEELELFITTLGQNPAVLEGHPFRFNIRLTSNLPQLVEVLRQGSGLTRGVLGRLWRFQP